MARRLEALDVDTEIRLLIKRYAPSSWEIHDLHDGLLLDDGGIGLDSVRVAELLLACEDRLGLAFPIDLLEGRPLTVRKLIDHARHNRIRHGNTDA